MPATRLRPGPSRSAARSFTAAPARVTLRLADGRRSHARDAAVWFCDPWPFGFQLLGLDGFLHRFRVTMSAYREWIERAPESP